MAGTRWVRLDVDYFHNPKVLAAGRDGRDLHLASICWAQRYLTDGHIPAEAIEVIAHDAGLNGRSTAVAVERTASSGLWLPDGGSFFLKDFVAMNGARVDVEREREQWRFRQQNARSRQRGHGDVTA
jgi:hypothetical protein